MCFNNNVATCKLQAAINLFKVLIIIKIFLEDSKMVESAGVDVKVQSAQRRSHHQTAKAGL